MKLKEIILLSSLIIIVGYIPIPKALDNKGIAMNEEKKRVYVEKLPIQTYEEYLRLNRFVLNQYLNLEEDSEGEVFLRDSTKIKYSFRDRYIYEVIVNIKKPFLEVLEFN